MRTFFPIFAALKIIMNDLNPLKVLVIAHVITQQ